MTQEAVAKALGIPTKTYQNYEREVREADSDVLCAIADLFNVSLDELVGRVEPHHDAIHAKTQQDELVGIFNSLDSSGRAMLLSIAKSIEGFHRQNA